MTSPALNFPESLADKYMPRRVADFVGLDGPKRALAAFVAKPYPSAWLFVGSSGTGKTSMALAMAAEIPAELRHVPSRDCNLQTVQDVAYHCHFMPWVGDNPDRPKRMHLVLVDEANEMTPPAQDAWLSKLDATDMPPNTVFVFTTNDTYRLADRFQSRCRVVKFSEDQSRAEIAGMLQKVWASENGSAPEPNYDAIVQESGGNIRSSLMKLELALLGLRPAEPVAINQAKPEARTANTCELCAASVLPRRRFCDPCYEKRKRCYHKANHKASSRKGTAQCA